MENGWMDGYGSPGQLFGLASQTAMIGWLILIVGPRRWNAIFWIPQFVIPAALSILYSTLMLAYFFTVDGGYDSIDSVRSLFENDYVLLAGWVHYLAFDLFIGAWIARRADRLGTSRLIQPIFLVATFMFGPLGLIMFLITRSFYPVKENLQ